MGLEQWNIINESQKHTIIPTKIVLLLLEFLEIPRLLFRFILLAITFTIIQPFGFLSLISQTDSLVYFPGNQRSF